MDFLLWSQTFQPFGKYIIQSWSKVSKLHYKNVTYRNFDQMVTYKSVKHAERHFLYHRFYSFIGRELSFRYGVKFLQSYQKYFQALFFSSCLIARFNDRHWVDDHWYRHMHQAAGCCKTEMSHFWDLFHLWRKTAGCRETRLVYFANI